MNLWIKKRCWYQSALQSENKAPERGGEQREAYNRSSLGRRRRRLGQKASHGGAVVQGSSLQHVPPGLKNPMPLGMGTPGHPFPVLRS